MKVYTRVKNLGAKEYMNSLHYYCIQNKLLIIK